jgi:hypothetical protein
MGELDLIKICFPLEGPGEGTRYAVRTVFWTWLPLAVAGIVLSRMVHVHATMRGAGLLRVLSHLAIAIQLAAVFSPLTFFVSILEGAWKGYLLSPAPWMEVVVASSVLLPIAAICIAAIIAWHRVLVALASREGDGRMLV